MRDSGNPDPTSQRSTVYLVGAGPGDPDLLTRKAEKLIRSCDALVFDYLVAKEILDWAPAHAEKICVGKRAGFHSLRQEEIQDVLVRLSLSGKTTVRLKGGDPFVFGRGGEEVTRLRSESIPYEVVPAITASIAAAARAEIPLTHRSFNSSVVFLTGHQDPSKEDTGVNWADYAKLQTTLCLYMAMGRLGKIRDSLIEGGLSPETPCAVIQWATTPEEKILYSALHSVAEDVEKANLSSPAIVIIGKTALPPQSSED
ncbi:uroporphyrinogen-III C-methyltransferase [Puniceicoccus vermicola]|uniref:uroporphyrinogen-III C-methyltransferase n=1 Tax=Puniceicoccus vermicola TaxID=388746 RepID=A0A7X1AUL1_9BACT|nr:uroporphyrinogen-III C-methyltransferase [Puniceicoccus vermicola]MBC2600222.1 uroporphyrinogen-III C-methyltransferase [Puniceicoccus vermicola]